MISRTSNGSSLQELDGPALVKTYNDLAKSDLGKELKAKTVERFSDRQTGIKRIEALRSSIRARQQGLEGMTDTPAPAPQQLNGIAGFKAREGSNRKKLLTHLFDNLNRQVPTEVLIAATYGKSDPEMRGAMMMVMKGVQSMIEKNNLPYTVRKEGKSYGLYDN